mmetsp:Transcript_21135/g.49511  ORF Transcript_21135/g.49511 Transcript_21135/m.49511 type:complete len:640 (-) Transcript_21135:856-2775(-)
MSMYLAAGLVVLLLAAVLYFAFGQKKPASAPRPMMSAVQGSGTGGGAKKAGAKVYGGPKIHIYFASQTGTAEGFAQKLEEEAHLRDLNVQIMDLEEFDPEEFVEHETVFMVTATYGEGEPTDNARTFHKWIVDSGKTLSETTLANTAYLVFGLGNRQYEHYQAMGTLFDTRLAALGGKRLCERGEGDDDGSIEEDFASWRETMWPAVMAHFGLPDIESKGPQKHVWKYTASFHSHADTVVPEFATKSSSSLEHHELSTVKTAVNVELHGPKSDRSCRHVELDIKGTGIKYESGDHVAIFPCNETALVQGLADRLGVSLDARFTLAAEGMSPFPCPTDMRTALTRYVEINAIKKSVLSVLAQHATSADEAKKLARLASKAGKDEFDTYAIKGYRNILDLLLDFPSINIKATELLELLPRMQPRYYSISSSNLAHPDTIHVTCAVERKKLPDREFKGVCSNYLLAHAVGETSQVFIRNSPFKLPSNPSTPLIMVGPGTGLAPIRGFIQELTLRQKKGDKLGKNYLFFGCQNREYDFIYEKELMEAARNGVLWKACFAFSREQAEKVYVQHKVAEEGEEVIRLLMEERAQLYVCGGTQMSKDVKATLIDLAGKYKGFAPQQAEAWLSELHDEGRYLQDVWST